MSYIGTSINDSPVVYGQAGAALTDPAFRAAAFDDDGNIVLVSTAGANALGLFIAEMPDVAAGDDVTVQIKESGLWATGEAVAAGAELACDADGKAVTAASGNFIVGIALEAAAAADEIIKVQITKSGYKA
ncbi:MAG: DUF2190 family protein [Lachnospiraceae bacterium]|nr:DUF2190 family protein [Lachnospiraceae bacterium]MCD8196134.1 DUF2190 family protein [Lachnospiraceae bacterium]